MQSQSQKYKILKEEEEHDEWNIIFNCFIRYSIFGMKIIKYAREEGVFECEEITNFKQLFGLE